MARSGTPLVNTLPTSTTSPLNAAVGGVTGSGVGGGAAAVANVPISSNSSNKRTRVSAPTPAITAVSAVGDDDDIPVMERKSSPKTESTVTDLLECPVCYEPMDEKIYQCTAGHLLCESCKGRLANCPTCRVSLGIGIRNRAMEKLAETLLAMCRHGCGLITHCAERRLHEQQQCALRPYPCPTVGTTCDWKGQASEIAEHFLRTHDCKRFETHHIDMTVTNSQGRAGDLVWQRLYSCHGVLALFVVERHTYYGRDRFVAYVRSITNDRPLNYRIKVERAPRKLSWEGPARSIREPKEVMRDSNDCLCLEPSMAYFFSGSQPPPAPESRLSLRFTGVITKRQSLAEKRRQKAAVVAGTTPVGGSPAGPPDGPLSSTSSTSTSSTSLTLPEAKIPALSSTSLSLRPLPSPPVVVLDDDNDHHAPILNTTNQKHARHRDNNIHDRIVANNSSHLIDDLEDDDDDDDDDIYEEDDDQFATESVPSRHHHRTSVTAVRPEYDEGEDDDVVTLRHAAPVVAAPASNSIASSSFGAHHRNSRDYRNAAVIPLASPLLAGARRPKRARDDNSNG